MSISLKNVLAFFIIINLTAVPVGTAASGIEKLIWAEEPQRATQVPFQNGDGNDVTLADFEGKVVVVNLWATWCAPCIREMPTLDTLQSEMGGKQLHVIAMSQDREGLPIAQPFKEKNEWRNLGLYVSPDLAFARNSAVKGLPTTLLIDKKGMEVARLQGTAEWDSEDLKGVLQGLIDKNE